MDVDAECDKLVTAFSQTKPTTLAVIDRPRRKKEKNPQSSKFWQDSIGKYPCF